LCLLGHSSQISEKIHDSRAQTPDGFGGCEDSPENPTLILAGLAAGAFAINSLRLRLRAPRASSDKK